MLKTQLPNNPGMADHIMRNLNIYHEQIQFTDALEKNQCFIFGSFSHKVKRKTPANSNSTKRQTQIYV